MRSIYLIGVLLLFLMITGCERVFEYHPNAVQLNESEKNLTQKYLEELGTGNPEDTIRLVLMGDTQRFYDHIQDFTNSARQQPNIDFMLHCGDISDFGMTQEFRWVHSLLQELPFPYLTVIGNHDLLSNGPRVYEEMYGPRNYYFDYNGVRFVMTDTNSREYEFDGTVPDLDWMASSLQLPESVHQAVVVGHVPPFDYDFDKALEEDFVNLLKDNNVELSLFGHLHNSEIFHPYGDEIKMVVTNSMKGRSYYVVEIWKEGHRVQEVTY